MKPWYYSKTIWFNVLTLLSTLAAAANEFLHMLEITLEPKTYMIVGFAVAVVNVVLRSVTKEGVLFRSNAGESNADVAE